MERDPNDYYPTPYNIIEAVIDSTDWFKYRQTIWEPCCGDRRFSEALETRGHTVISHDIVEGYNFFDWKNKQANIICTNPPFKFAREFISKAFELGVEKMVLVLPERIFASKAGLACFKKHPPSKFVNLSWREDYLGKGGAPDRSLSVAWWERNKSVTIFDVLVKPTKQTELFEVQ